MERQLLLQKTKIEGVKLYRGSDVASVLGYARPNNVVRDKIIVRNNRELKKLNPEENYDYNTTNTVYIDEAGLRS